MSPTGVANATFTFNGGTLALPGLFSITQGTVNLNHGPLSGTMELTNCVLTLREGVNLGTASFTLQGRTSLVGNVPAGTTLLVQGTATTPAVLAPVSIPFTNFGTIILEGNASLNALRDFVNRGSLITRPGSGGQRRVSADLTNEGTVTSTADTEFVTESGVFTNRNVFTVAASTSFRFTFLDDTGLYLFALRP